MKAAVEQNMLLLFGMPRSGTTWLGKLFDSHPNTYYLHEPDTVFPKNDLPLLTTAQEIENRSDEVRLWLNDILIKQHQKVTAFPPLFAKDYMSTWQSALLKTTTFASRINSKLNSPLKINPIRIINNNSSALMVWKSIESMGRMGLISSLCPNAKAIHILRHPCGHVNSTLQGFARQKFSTQTPIHEDWDLFDKIIKQSGHQQFTLDDIKAMAPEERLAFRWGVMNDHCLASLPKEQLLPVRYEDVCEDPLGSVKSMFSWADIEISDQSEHFIKISTADHKDSYYGTTKDPKKSAYSWKKKLSEQQISNILKMVSNFESGKYYLDQQ